MNAYKDGVILSVGHIIPRRLGGTDELSNLQTICTTCNAIRGDTYITCPDCGTPIDHWNDRWRRFLYSLFSKSLV